MPHVLGVGLGYGYNPVEYVRAIFDQNRDEGPSPPTTIDWYPCPTPEQPGHWGP